MLDFVRWTLYGIAIVVVDTWHSIKQAARGE